MCQDVTTFLSRTHLGPRFPVSAYRDKNRRPVPLRFQPIAVMFRPARNARVITTILEKPVGTSPEFQWERGATLGGARDRVCLPTLGPPVVFLPRAAVVSPRPLPTHSTTPGFTWSQCTYSQMTRSCRTSGQTSPSADMRTRQKENDRPDKKTAGLKRPCRTPDCL